MKITFSFGKNWVNYVKNFVDWEKLKDAEKSLLKYLNEKDYKDKVFIDVGCGSGIFSLGAINLGTKKTISFDIDSFSIKATRLIKEKYLNKKADWEIFKGDILDEELVKRFSGTGDILYSWGTLHHTGNMYRAIKNTCELVKPNGYVILAIYNKAPSSDFWLKVKKFYNLVPALIKILMVYLIFLYVVFKRMGFYLKSKITGKASPILSKKTRGMSIFHDVVDWLGGYPYEYATFEEIKGYVENLGFKLIKAPTKLPSSPKTFFNRFSFKHIGNNEFVFQRI